jgi:hypothetical protein
LYIAVQNLNPKAQIAFQKQQAKIKMYDKRPSLGAAEKIVHFAKMVGSVALSSAEILPYSEYYFRMSNARNERELELNLQADAQAEMDAARNKTR